MGQVALYTKLFVIMGILWIAECLEHFLKKTNVIENSIIFDIIAVVNMLRGFFIFIIFICKKSIWKGLKKLVLKSPDPPRPSACTMKTFTRPSSNDVIYNESYA